MIFASSILAHHLLRIYHSTHHKIPFFCVSPTPTHYMTERDYDYFIFVSLAFNTKPHTWEILINFMNDLKVRNLSLIKMNYLAHSSQSLSDLPHNASATATRDERL